ncbi:MAG: hypothetical protein OXQ90_19110 [Gammaproteobacteria bacterium]|nr:hypothetical protein [Gammaproteobacteria bacterium]
MKGCRAMGAAALAAGLGWGGESPELQARTRQPAAEPEKIDVVYERLGVQRRTLEAVVQIVTQLEAVANQSDAAAELLSDQGDPTERLKRALDEVVSRRPGRVADGAVAPVVVEAQIAAPEDHVRGSEEEPRHEVAVEVVYAERVSAGRSRVVVAVRGAHYATSVGQRILVGEDVVEVVRIVEEGDDGLTVVLRVNGGAPVRRRVRS